jgi:ubiquinone/menaquinone biosynthesis C-methylase UbiE
MQIEPPVIDYEGSDYQTSFWDHGEREYEDRVEAIALQRLLPKTGKRLLELGAGAGRNTLRYSGFQQIVLVDYSSSQLKLAKEKLGNSDRYIFVAANIYKLPFAPVFDTATMIRTLHHMAQPSLALQQVQKAMAPDSIFILEYANKRNIKAILRYITFQQKWNPFNQEPIEFVELNYDFHPSAIVRWLKENKFEIERQLTVSHFRIGILKRIIPLPILIKMDSIAQLTGNLWQYSPSIFVRSKSKKELTDNPYNGIFCCPVCGGSQFEETEDRIICASCSVNWSIRDGIYDFREQLT